MRIARFSIVGAAGIGVQLAMLWALTGPAGLHYLPATLVAVTAAIIHNFGWHRLWTWRDRPGGRWPSALARFAGLNGLVSIAGNALVMAVLTGGFGMPAVLANVVAIVTCGIANFALADRLVFIGRGAHDAVEAPTPLLS